ncbi:MAG: transporter substrate-binding domain-containing protein [Proteobacteria bacterium]|nr:transporter substrate-binding domain-containing protein [Pseudomonadota bacterium]
MTGLRRVLGASLLGLAAGLLCTAAQAKEWKTVRIGTDATYPPFESVNAKGEIVGWEVDYGNALCERMKVTCTWQNQDWDGIIPALLSGKFDTIISSMNITPPRAEKVAFSQVYYSTPPGFIGPASLKSNDVSPEALKGKTIGAQSSTVFANYLSKFYPGSDVKLYPGGDEALIELANGRLDYVMVDTIVAQAFIDKNGNGCCKVVGTVKRLPDIFGPGVGAAFRKDDPDLRAMFDKAISELAADGTFQKIASKYFKIDIMPKQ